MGNLAPGSKLGRYELLVPVGRGGMAVVWAARLRGSRGFTKTVAVKTMIPALSADPRFEQMFLDEAKLAARVKHPNVCEVLDLGEERRVLYLVMDWVDGGSLADLRRAHGGKLPYGAAMRIALDVARGLKAAHEATDEEGAPLGIVHRDVSPQNILVARDGSALIADFGVAKATEKSSGTTNAGYVKGKVRYMAPEQVYCERVDARTDVFALGLVLYEAVTGTNPITAETDVGTLARIAAPDPVPDPPDVPPELAGILRRALAKDAGARFQSMSDLAEALASVVASFPDSATSDVAALVRKAGRPTAIEGALRDADARATPAAWEPSSLTIRPRRSALLAVVVLGSVLAATAFVVSRRDPAPRATAGPSPSPPPIPIPIPIPTPTPILSPIPIPSPTPIPIPSPTPTPNPIPPRVRPAPLPAASSAPPTPSSPRPPPTSSNDVLRTRE